MRRLWALGSGLSPVEWNDLGAFLGGGKVLGSVWLGGCVVVGGRPVWRWRPRTTICRPAGSTSGWGFGWRGATPCFIKTSGSLSGMRPLCSGICCSRDFYGSVVQGWCAGCVVYFSLDWYGARPVGLCMVLRFGALCRKRYKKSLRKGQGLVSGGGV